MPAWDERIRGDRAIQQMLHSKKGDQIACFACHHPFMVEFDEQILCQVCRDARGLTQMEKNA